MLDTKTLCLQLLNADSEEDVIRILKLAGYWGEPSAWREFNDDPNNYSTIGNQSASADSALVEKLVNSVDAMLMGAAQADTKNSKQPQTIAKAVESYFGVKDGRISYLSPQQRTTLAEKIHLVSTGSKTKPCYSIIDEGEGQTPQGLPETILGISKTNKIKIPFVQGKFHMGGTGALRFCGREHFQLVISKRNPEIPNLDNDPTYNQWGFTLIRRESRDGFRSSIFTYLAPNKEILSFTSDSLPLIPGDYPQAYSKPLRHGTLIKLYEYNLKGYLTNVLFDANYRLSLLLPEIALPIRICERRNGYSGHSFEANLSGLRVRLEDAEDKETVIESGFPNSEQIIVDGEKLKAEIFLFKKGKSEKYRKKDGIIFTINGQTHGTLRDNFFKRKNTSMGYLSDSILVICDCSEFSTQAREDLFMNSRDRLSDSSTLKSKIERELEKLLHNHEGLRRIQNERRQDELNEKLSDSKPFQELLNNSLRTHPSLAALLNPGKKIKTPFNMSKSRSFEESYQGKEFPTYFLLKEKQSSKECPLNKKCRVQFETDVQNDYFSRSKYAGVFQLFIDGFECENYSLNLWNGIATLNIALPDDSKPGDILKFEAQVNGELQSEVFVNTFHVTCCDVVQNKNQRSTTGERKLPLDLDEALNSKEQGREAPSSLGLPLIKEVNRDEWKEHGFSENSALNIKPVPDGSGYDFYLNMDNLSLLSEIKARKAVDARLLKEQFKYGMVLAGISLIHQYETTKNNNEELDDFIKTASAGLASIILPVIDILGSLEIEQS